MSTTIQPTDIKLNYVSIASARKMSGLRLVLGAYSIPGPWREACKGLFHVKGIPYTPVVTADEGKSDLAIGMDGSQSELIAWTGQASAPVKLTDESRPIRRDDAAALITWSTAHSWRALGLPCRAVGAKASNASS